jgi:hypothetical protein
MRRAGRVPSGNQRLSEGSQMQPQQARTLLQGRHCLFRCGAVRAACLLQSAHRNNSNGLTWFQAKASPIGFRINILVAAIRLPYTVYANTWKRDAAPACPQPTEADISPKRGIRVLTPNQKRSVHRGNRRARRHELKSASVKERPRTSGRDRRSALCKLHVRFGRYWWPT